MSEPRSSRLSEPLQNRVDPFGRLQKSPTRGLFMGNRGGRFHNDARSLGPRRHVSRRWITCVCRFGDRRRDVWGRGYMELFFFDATGRQKSTWARVSGLGTIVLSRG